MSVGRRSAAALPGAVKKKKIGQKSWIFRRRVSIALDMSRTTDSQTPRVCLRRRPRRPPRWKSSRAPRTQTPAGSPSRDARARAPHDGIVTLSRSRASSLASIGRASQAHGARVRAASPALSRSPAKKPRLAASAIRGTRGRVRTVRARNSARSSHTWLAVAFVRRGARGVTGDPRTKVSIAAGTSRLCLQSKRFDRIHHDRPTDRGLPRCSDACVSARSARGPRVASDRGDVRDARKSARDLRPSRPLSAHNGLWGRGRESARQGSFPRAAWVSFLDPTEPGITNRRCVRSRRGRDSRQRFCALSRGFCGALSLGAADEGSLSRARPTRATAALCGLVPAPGQGPVRSPWSARRPSPTRSPLRGGGGCAENEARHAERDKRRVARRERRASTRGRGGERRGRYRRLGR